MKLVDFGRVELSQLTRQKVRLLLVIFLYANTIAALQQSTKYGAHRLGQNNLIVTQSSYTIQPLLFAAPPFSPVS